MPDLIKAFIDMRGTLEEICDDCNITPPKIVFANRLEEYFPQDKSGWRQGVDGVISSDYRLAYAKELETQYAESKQEDVFTKVQQQANNAVIEPIQVSVEIPHQAVVVKEQQNITKEQIKQIESGSSSQGVLLTNGRSNLPKIPVQSVEKFSMLQSLCKYINKLCMKLKNIKNIFKSGGQKR
jgi:hypothetical protein